MKYKVVGIFICILLIMTALPVSGNNDSEMVNKILNQNEKYHSANVFLFGIIKDKQSGNITTFIEVRVLEIIIHDYNGTKIPWVGIARNSMTDFDNRLHQFRGIFLNHFICGVVKYPKVTSSPGSIPFSEPAELEIGVSVNDEGASDVLVNISIPGISGEMSTHTDANGKSLFVFTPPTTGEIEVEIENKKTHLTVEITD